VRQPNDEMLDETVRRAFPWGPPFAMRANFEAGYLSEERRLIAKYLLPRSDVLVLGSGNGREARPICRNGHRIVCMDIGVLYLVSGQQLFDAEGVRDVAFMQADVERLPFVELSFDFMFFSFYSGLKERRFEVLCRLRRLLRRDGVLLLGACTPRYKDMYRNSYPGTDGWAFISDTEQLRQEVASCGFELLESDIDPIRPEYRFSILKTVVADAHATGSRSAIPCL
jgi:ubiquinone/menaquinone biosynthesis C-methylase UbiE